MSGPDCEARLLAEFDLVRHRGSGKFRVYSVIARTPPSLVDRWRMAINCLKASTATSGCSPRAM